MSEDVLIQNKSNSVGTAGFVLALIGFFFGWVPVLGWIVWLLGLILSSVGISKAKKTGVGKGLSIAGLVISLVFVVVFVLLAGVVAALFGTAAAMY
ncbi:MAG: hypothetical protein HRT66_02800 [Flavobacteriaceae bacterium]|nr:hypothetical protein [Flavobacteriaceae bacterium]